MYASESGLKPVYERSHFKPLRSRSEELKISPLVNLGLNSYNRALFVSSLRIEAFINIPVLLREKRPDTPGYAQHRSFRMEWFAFLETSENI